MPFATRSEAALQLDLSWLHKKLENVPIGRVAIFFECNRRGCFNWFFGDCSALGWSARELESVDALDLFYQADRKSFVNVVGSIAARGEVMADHPVHLRCKDGAWWVTVRG